MYQVIPENLSEILLKRVIVLITLLVIITGSLFLQQYTQLFHYPKVETPGPVNELPNAGIAFTSLEF